MVGIGKAVIVVLATVALAGCVDVSEGVNVSTSSSTRYVAVNGMEVPPGHVQRDLEVGAAEFVLGPVGNTPVSETSFTLGFELPTNATDVQVRVEFGEGSTVNFEIAGPGNCAPSGNVFAFQSGGSDRSMSCGSLGPGAHEVTLRHATGHVSGSVAVVARLIVPE